MCVCAHQLHHIEKNYRKAGLSSFQVRCCPKPAEQVVLILVLSVKTHVCVSKQAMLMLYLVFFLLCYWQAGAETQIASKC